MRAGKFDRRVQIFRAVPARNALSGQPQETFNLWKSVWAELVPVSASEGFEAEARRAKQQVLWNMRPVSGLSEKDQLHHGGRIYRITGILETVRGRQIQVTSEVFQ